MVFFTCNACGASLKKNQVEKHYRNECRNCSVLSCMDCGQDFYGDDYVGHTKCISEAEKYQGGMYKGAESKGDQKQQAWLEKAQAAIQGAKVSPKIASLLRKIVTYPNIPRKKKKFENFVQNSCCVRDKGVLEELWQVFTTEQQSAEPETDPARAPPDVSSTETVALVRVEESAETGNANGEAEPEEVKKPPKEKKKKIIKIESSHPEQDHLETPNTDTPVHCEEGQKASKKKKIKSESSNPVDPSQHNGCEDNGCEVDNSTSVRRKKIKDSSRDEGGEGSEDAHSEEVGKKKQKKQLSNGDSSVIACELSDSAAKKTHKKSKKRSRDVEQSQVKKIKLSEDLSGSEAKPKKKRKKKVL